MAGDQRPRRLRLRHASAGRAHAALPRPARWRRCPRRWPHDDAEPPRESGRAAEARASLIGVERRARARAPVARSTREFRLEAACPSGPSRSTAASCSRSASSCRTARTPCTSRYRCSRARRRRPAALRPCARTSAPTRAVSTGQPRAVHAWRDLGDRVEFDRGDNAAAALRLHGDGERRHASTAEHERLDRSRYPIEARAATTHRVAAGARLRSALMLEPGARCDVRRVHRAVGHARRARRPSARCDARADAPAAARRVERAAPADAPGRRAGARGRPVHHRARPARVEDDGARPRRRRRAADGDRRLPLVHRLGPRHDDQPRRADARHRPASRGAATSCARSRITSATG